MLNASIRQVTCELTATFNILQFGKTLFSINAATLEYFLHIGAHSRLAFSRGQNLIDYSSLKECFQQSCFSDCFFFRIPFRAAELLLG